MTADDFFPKVSVFATSVSRNLKLVCPVGELICPDKITCRLTRVECPGVYQAVVSELIPSFAPQLGGFITLVGSAFVPSSLSVQVGTEPGTNMTFVPLKSSRTALLQAGATEGSFSGSIVFLTPLIRRTGYIDVALSQCEGVITTLPGALYITDDCPVAGSFGKGTDCKPCPEGGICPGGNRIVPKPGYWNSGEESGFVTPCDPPERCLGGATSTCASGYTGTLCSSCDKDFYADGSSCHACNLKETTGNLALVALTAMLCAFVGVFVASVLFASDSTLSNVAMTLITVQIFQQSMVNSSHLPPTLSTPLKLVQLVSMDFSFIRSECTRASFGVSPFSFKFLGTLGLPLLSAVIIVAAIPLIQWCWRLRLTRGRPTAAKAEKLEQIRSFYKHRRLRGLLLVLVVFYAALTSRSLSALECTRFQGNLVLARELGTRCWAREHVGVGLAAVLVLACVTVALPVGLTGLFLRNRNLLWEKEFQARFGYFYEATKREYFLTGIGRLAVALCLSVSTSLLDRHAFVMVLLNSSALGIFLLFVVAARPFILMWKNVVLFISLGASLCGTLANYFQASSPRTSLALSYTSGALALLMIGILFLRFVAHVLHNWRKKKRQGAVQTMYSPSPQRSSDEISRLDLGVESEGGEVDLVVVAGPGEGQTPEDMAALVDHLTSELQWLSTELSVRSINVHGLEDVLSFQPSTESAGQRIENVLNSVPDLRSGTTEERSLVRQYLELLLRQTRFFQQKPASGTLDPLPGVPSLTVNPAPGLSSLDGVAPNGVAPSGVADSSEGKKNKKASKSNKVKSAKEVGKTERSERSEKDVPDDSGVKMAHDSTIGGGLDAEMHDKDEHLTARFFQPDEALGEPSTGTLPRSPVASATELFSLPGACIIEEDEAPLPRDLFAAALTRLESATETIAAFASIADVEMALDAASIGTTDEVSVAARTVQAFRAMQGHTAEPLTAKEEAALGRYVACALRVRQATNSLFDHSAKSTQGQRPSTAAVSKWLLTLSSRSPVPLDWERGEMTPRSVSSEEY